MIPIPEQLSADLTDRIQNLSVAQLRALQTVAVQMREDPVPQDPADPRTPAEYAADTARLQDVFETVAQMAGWVQRELAREMRRWERELKSEVIGFWGSAEITSDNGGGAT